MQIYTKEEIEEKKDAVVEYIKANGYIRRDGLIIEDIYQEKMYLVESYTQHEQRYMTLSEIKDYIKLIFEKEFSLLEIKNAITNDISIKSIFKNLTFNFLIAKEKEKDTFPTQTELAAYLGVTKGAVSQYDKTKKELMLLGLSVIKQKTIS